MYISETVAAVIVNRTGPWQAVSKTMVFMLSCLNGHAASTRRSRIEILMAELDGILPRVRMHTLQTLGFALCFYTAGRLCIYRADRRVVRRIENSEPSTGGIINY